MFPCSDILEYDLGRHCTQRMQHKSWTQLKRSVIKVLASAYNDIDFVKVKLISSSLPSRESYQRVSNIHRECLSSVRRQPRLGVFCRVAQHQASNGKKHHNNLAKEEKKRSSSAWRQQTKIVDRGANSTDHCLNRRTSCPYTAGDETETYGWAPGLVAMHNSNDLLSNRWLLISLRRCTQFHHSGTPYKQRNLEERMRSG